MELKKLMLETCAGLTPIWNEIGRRDPSLADQGRRAMQSVVLQYAEGLHALGGSRKARLLGARSEAHEARVCLELACACGLTEEKRVARASDTLDRIAATLWLKASAEVSDGEGPGSRALVPGSRFPKSRFPIPGSRFPVPVPGSHLPGPTSRVLDPASPIPFP